MDKKYKAIIKNSLSADGLGLPSISIYYGGCDKKALTGYFCKGCQNVELQDNPDIPDYYNEELYNYVIQFLDDWHDISDKVAISFIGGEPLAKYNRESVLFISKKLKENYDFVETVLYTWRTKEDISKQSISNYLEFIDKTVCGEYKEELKNDNYLLGSVNQYIYDFKNNIVILEYKEERV